LKLPVVLNIRDEVVIFGGGHVALRKIEYISNFTKNISVVTKEAFNLPDYVKLIIKSININDIPNYISENTALVISALSDSDINYAIADWCKNHDILINVVDNTEHSTILFPALSKKNDLSISISTSGKCPFLARKIREDTDRWIEEKARWLEVLSPIREKLVGIEEKNHILSIIYEDIEVKKMIKEGNTKNAIKKAWEIYNVHLKH
jgi:siroheme synthase-like protein